MKSRRPKALDLFAGAGGMSLGFEQAGFDIAAAVEVDPIHAATHHYNFPNTRILARSIMDLSGENVLAAAGLKPGEISVVFGGPPCQGFSLIGHRVLDDPRNSLVREFLRMVVEVDSPYFVFENVKGLTVGRHQYFLDSLIDEFSRMGYEISMPWQVLNARNYGVPQDRERLFLLGAKRGLTVPMYPSAQTAGTTDLFAPSRLPTVPTCMDALEDIPNSELYEQLREQDFVRVKDWRPKSRYARELHCLGAKSWHYGYRRNWDAKLLTSSMRTDHTSISQRRFEETQEGEVEPISRFHKLRTNGQCNTLRAGTDSARGAFTSPRPIHFAYPRCISVREMARLHGYPDWFRFHVTKWHGARQVGNSVPPPLARAVASSVMKAMEICPVAPEEVWDLGIEALLSMGMTEAAKYFGVQIPIARRDRKSGARKRKQVEIELARLAGSL